MPKFSCLVCYISAKKTTSRKWKEDENHDHFPKVNIEKSVIPIWPNHKSIRNQIWWLIFLEICIVILMPLNTGDLALGLVSSMVLPT